MIAGPPLGVATAPPSASQRRPVPHPPASRQTPRPIRWRGRCASSASGPLGGALPPPDEEPPERTYTPFSRLRERNPYRLLGLSKDAEFQEVMDARNFLFKEYRWHAPSREAIELAFDNILQEKLRQRNRSGFRAPGSSSSRRAPPSPPSLPSRIHQLFDPTVTPRTLINEGCVFAGLALWALFSADQSFPLAVSLAYSVYKTQSKRIKARPEGPFLGGSPMVGALLTTLLSLAVACLVMALVTLPLGAVVEGSLRQLGGCIVVAIIGVLSVYLK